MRKIKLAIFDVAGTTAQDDGLVVQAFQGAMVAVGEKLDTPEMNRMTKYVNLTMGERKMDVFMHLCEGDAKKAQIAHDQFVDGYIELVKSGRLKEFEGVTQLFDQLRTGGTAVGITTGFPRDILDTIIEALNWAPSIDFSVASSEVVQGRPAPDMIFRAIELYNKRYETHIDPSETAVIGDTEADMRAGVTAGSLIVAGVTTGAHHREQLFDAGATHVLESSVDLPSVC